MPPTAHDVAGYEVTRTAEAGAGDALLPCTAAADGATVASASTFKRGSMGASCSGAAAYMGAGKRQWHVGAASGIPGALAAVVASSLAGVSHGLS